MGVVDGIARSGDPSFLPLATSLRARAPSLGVPGRGIADDLSEVLPKLRAVAATRSPVRLANDALRVMTAMCVRSDDRDWSRIVAASGRDDRWHSDACAEVVREFAASVDHIRVRPRETRQELDGLVGRINCSIARTS